MDRNEVEIDFRFAPVAPLTAGYFNSHREKDARSVSAEDFIPSTSIKRAKKRAEWDREKDRLEAVRTVSQLREMQDQRNRLKAKTNARNPNPNKKS